MRLVNHLVIVCLFLAWSICEGKQEKKVRLQQYDRESRSTSCKEGSFALNECDERCECSEGKLTNCYRVRKDFLKLSIADRKRFIGAYLKVSVDPKYKQAYEDLVAFHSNTSSKLLHETNYIFFPWHRWYLLQIENALRKIDCRITVPYWDWSRVANHWWKGSAMEDFWNPGEHGFGGDGDRNDGNCVKTGLFRKEKWQLLKITRGGGCLKRYFWYVPLTGNSAHVNMSVSLPLEKFFVYEAIVRGIYHNELHDFIGGTMSSGLTAANAPELPTHHSFLDLIWVRWQNRGVKYRDIYYPSIHFKLPFAGYYGWEWMDNNNLPGNVKAVYEVNGEYL